MSWLYQQGSNIKVQLSPAHDLVAYETLRTTPAAPDDPRSWVLEGADPHMPIPRVRATSITFAQAQAIETAIHLLSKQGHVDALTERHVVDTRRGTIALANTNPNLPAPTTTASTQKGVFARIWAWLKSIWARVTGSSAPAGAAGVGATRRGHRAPSSASSCPAPTGDGWMLRDMASGDCVELTSAEGCAFFDAASAVKPPPPVFHHMVPRTHQRNEAIPAFMFYNANGLGQTVSRAQGEAGLRAIALLHETHAAIETQVQQAIDYPMATAITSRVPTDGNHVHVDENAWRTALALVARGGAPDGFRMTAAIDAALSVLEISNDADTIAQVAANAAGGDVNAALVAKALVDAEIACNKMIAEAIVDGLAQGDGDAAAAAQSYVAAARMGDHGAHLVVRAIGDALDELPPDADSVVTDCFPDADDHGTLNDCVVDPDDCVVDHENGILYADVDGSTCAFWQDESGNVQMRLVDG